MTYERIDHISNKVPKTLAKRKMVRTPHIRMDKL